MDDERLEMIRQLEAAIRLRSQHSPDADELKRFIEEDGGMPYLVDHVIEHARECRVIACLESALATLKMEPEWCFMCDRPKDDCACVDNGGTY